ncbi:hypothetical protein DF029_21500 [Burkholderia cepacia]|nr:hypothetical protein DF029_21500 [Burkholderia cepacia]
MPPAKKLFKHLMRDDIFDQECLIFPVLEQQAKPRRRAQYEDLFPWSRKLVNLKARPKIFESLVLEQVQHVAYFCSLQWPQVPKCLLYSVLDN